MLEKLSHETLEGALALFCCGFVSSYYSYSNKVGVTLLFSMDKYLYVFVKEVK